MTSYEVIDAVCDSVSPVLFFIALGLLLKQTRTGLGRARAGLLFLLAGLGLVYGFMYLDKALGLWASFGGDYSTHTAFALVVSLSIVWSSNKKLLTWVVFGIYLALMRYQQYHSFLDMGTTILAVGLPLVLFARYVCRLGTPGQSHTAASEDSVSPST